MPQAIQTIPPIGTFDFAGLCNLASEQLRSMRAAEEREQIARRLAGVIIPEIAEHDEGVARALREELARQLRLLRSRA